MGCAASFVKSRFGAYAYRRQRLVEPQKVMHVKPDSWTIKAAFSVFRANTEPEDILAAPAFAQWVDMADVVVWTAQQLLDANVAGQPVHGDGTVIADNTDGFVPEKYTRPEIGKEGEDRVARWAGSPLIPACVLLYRGGKYTMLDGTHRMLMQLRAEGKFRLCVLEDPGQEEAEEEEHE